MPDLKLLAQVQAMLMLTAFGNASYADIWIDDPRLDGALIEFHDERYRWSFDGALMDGPVRHAGDGVDYSPLFKYNYLYDSFLTGISSCISGVYHCSKNVPPIRHREIRLKLFFERGTMNGHDFDRLSYILEKTLLPASISLGAVAEVDAANIIMYIGSPSYLRIRLRENGDEIGNDGLRLVQRDLHAPADILEASHYMKGDRFCYTSTLGEHAHVDAYVYIDSRIIEDCASHGILASLGLRGGDVGAPSATLRSAAYSVSTFSDILFLRLLYHDEFPRNGDIEDIREFLRIHGWPTWIELLQDDISD